jgi:hypothetical protein
MKAWLDLSPRDTEKNYSYRPLRRRSRSKTRLRTGMSNVHVILDAKKPRCGVEAIHINSSKKERREMVCETQHTLSQGNGGAVVINMDSKEICNFSGLAFAGYYSEVNQSSPPPYELHPDFVFPKRIDWHYTSFVIRSSANIDLREIVFSEITVF